MIKLILACQEVLKWVWPSTNQNRLLFNQLNATSETAPRAAHQKLLLSWKITLIYKSKQYLNTCARSSKERSVKSHFINLPGVCEGIIDFGGAFIVTSAFGRATCNHNLIALGAFLLIDAYKRIQSLVNHWRELPPCSRHGVANCQHSCVDQTAPHKQKTTNRSQREPHVRRQKRERKVVPLVLHWVICTCVLPAEITSREMVSLKLFRVTCSIRIQKEAIKTRMKQYKNHICSENNLHWTR